MRVIHGGSGPEYRGYPTLSYAEWHHNGQSIWGNDYFSWKFQCPMCGNVASVRDHFRYTNEDRVEAFGRAYFSCLGRFDGHMNVYMGVGQPCNYTNGGLFCFARLVVTTPEGDTPVFLFYDPHPIEHQDVIGGVE